MLETSRVWDDVVLGLMKIGLLVSVWWIVTNSAKHSVGEMQNYLVDEQK